jgi:hypothetical protein
MSSDSDVSIGFMEGIRELGLALDDDPLPAKPPDSVKPKPQDPSPATKPPSRRGSRGRAPEVPPRRRRGRPSAPRLDLLGLLDDLPAPPPPALPDPSPEPPLGPGMEERIGDYFTAQSRQVADSFRVEIAGMLHHPDRIDQIVRAFVTDLRTAVKQAINFESETIVLTGVLSKAEGPIAEFREAIAAAERPAHASGHAALATVATVRDLVRGRIASIRDTIGRTTERIDGAVGELEQARLAQRRHRAEKEQRQSLLASQLSEIEAKAIGVRGDREVYEQLRRKGVRLTDSMGNVAIASELRDVVNVLQDHTEADAQIFQFMRRKKLETAEHVQEIQAFRVEWEREERLYSRSGY